MRTKFLNFVVPMAVVALGLAGAASTNAMNESTEKLIPVMGWKHVSGDDPCQEVQECSNFGDFDCTAPGGAQLYSKPDATCLNPLKRDIK
jgi:hypothetical protein